MNKIYKEVERFITKDGEIDVSLDENLLEKALLDSMGIIELISIIEEFSKKEFNPEQFVMDNFKTLGAIKDFLEVELDD